MADLVLCCSRRWFSAEGFQTGRGSPANALQPTAESYFVCYNQAPTLALYHPEALALLLSKEPGLLTLKTLTQPHGRKDCCETQDLHVSLPQQFQGHHRNSCNACGIDAIEFSSNGSQRAEGMVSTAGLAFSWMQQSRTTGHWSYQFSAGYPSINLRSNRQGYGTLHRLR